MNNLKLLLAFLLVCSINATESFIIECKPLWGQNNNGPEYSKVDFIAAVFQFSKMRVYIEDVGYDCKEANSPEEFVCGENMEIAYFHQERQLTLGGRGFKCTFLNIDDMP